MAKRYQGPDRLAQDAAEALTARMSYGKWMAMNYTQEAKSPNTDLQEKILPEPKKAEKGERVCKICGKIFFPKVHNQLCCCSECSEVNEMQRKRAFRLKKKLSKL